MASFKIRFVNENEGIDSTVECPDNKYILDQAEDSGLELPFSCRSGACSTCCVKIKEGTLDQSEQEYLDEDQIKEGYALICCSYPKSDLVLQTHQEDEI